MGQKESQSNNLWTEGVNVTIMGPKESKVAIMRQNPCC